MTSNIGRTIRTLVGFGITLLRKYTPLKLSRVGLNGIYNYRLISERIATSGQPSEEQFVLIRNHGYQTVINLAPQHGENSLPDEASLLRKLGMKYIHIPVDFKNPTEENFQTFVEAMRESQSQRTWVHCAANMRVSAFVFRYRRDVLNEDPARAKSDLEKVWEPSGPWAKFISSGQGSKGHTCRGESS